MIQFVNNNICEVGLQINSIKDMSDCGILVVLIGFVGGFFVPMNRYSLKATQDTQKTQNVNLAFELMEKIGVDTQSLSKQGILRLTKICKTGT